MTMISTMMLKAISIVLSTSKVTLMNKECGDGVWTLFCASSFDYCIPAFVPKGVRTVHPPTNGLGVSAGVYMGVSAANNSGAASLEVESDYRQRSGPDPSNGLRRSQQLAI